MGTEGGGYPGGWVRREVGSYSRDWVLPPPPVQVGKKSWIAFDDSNVSAINSDFCTSKSGPGPGPGPGGGSGARVLEGGHQG